MKGSIFEVRTSVESLSVYRELIKDEVISALYLLLEDLLKESSSFHEFLNHYNDLCYKLFRKNPDGNLKDYIEEVLVFNENSFSNCSERMNFGELDNKLLHAVIRDLKCLEIVSDVSPESIKEAAKIKFGHAGYIAETIDDLPSWSNEATSWSNGAPPLSNGAEVSAKDSFVGSKGSADVQIPHVLAGDSWDRCVKALAGFYHKNGSGRFALYRGFIWERDSAGGHMEGIFPTDPVRLGDLVGYELEREEVIDNTLHFLKGYPANNVLLYGDRGTGKSSTVKALLNEYGHLGLRMIELPKTYLCDLHYVIRTIKDRPQKFIIFIDDLAFGDNEEDFTALKAVLEGRLESRPQNIVIYATSNRRHLVKEKFSDRAGLISENYDEEVNAADTMQEKFSLADRFGITVTFSSPDRKKYLTIVEALSEQRGLHIDTETLHKEALRWEMYHNGLSPRTARQFIDWLVGRLGISRETSNQKPKD